MIDLRELNDTLKLNSLIIRAALNLPSLTKNKNNAPEASTTNVRTNPEKLRQYANICGFSTTNTTPQSLPPTYPQILAAPLHAALLASPHFPHSALGLVHTHQQIHQLRPIHITETLDLTAHLLPPRETPRGTEYDIETTVHTHHPKKPNELVWQSTTTMLIRAKKTKSPKPKPSTQTTTPQSTQTQRSLILRAPEDLGRRYAHISGDYNPIHLHASTARLFGFPRAIIHGMWSLARSVAELSDDIAPENLHIYAEFRRPILLPSRLLFTSTPTPDHPTTFTLQTPDQSKTYLTGHAQNPQ